MNLFAGRRGEGEKEREREREEQRETKKERRREKREKEKEKEKEQKQEEGEEEKGMVGKGAHPNRCPRRSRRARRGERSSTSRSPLSISVRLRLAGVPLDFRSAIAAPCCSPAESCEQGKFRAMPVRVAWPEEDTTRLGAGAVWNKVSHFSPP